MWCLKFSNKSRSHFQRPREAKGHMSRLDPHENRQLQNAGQSHSGSIMAHSAWFRILVTPRIAVVACNLPKEWCCRIYWTVAVWNGRNSHRKGHIVAVTLRSWWSDNSNISRPQQFPYRIHRLLIEGHAIIRRIFEPHKFEPDQSPTVALYNFQTKEISETLSCFWSLTAGHPCV